MEKYIINGREVEYDTFDLDNMEAFDAAIKRVQASAKALNPKSLNGDNYLLILREQCEGILDAFDDILGEGSARDIFGGRVNAKEILTAYQGFVKDVTEQRATLSSTAAAPRFQNREQRRAAEREQRRKAAVITNTGEA